MNPSSQSSFKFGPRIRDCLYLCYPGSGGKSGTAYGVVSTIISTRMDLHHESLTQALRAIIYEATFNPIYDLTVEHIHAVIPHEWEDAWQEANLSILPGETIEE